MKTDGWLLVILTDARRERIDDWRLSLLLSEDGLAPTQKSFFSEAANAFFARRNLETRLFRAWTLLDLIEGVRTALELS